MEMSDREPLIDSEQLLPDKPPRVHLSWNGLVASPIEQTGWPMWRTTQVGKRILKNVDGELKPGELLAVIGSSGSGKTTLLSILAQRQLGGLIVSGTVKLDGEPAGKWQVREAVAMVPQRNSFVGGLTPREHLWFAARLRMPSPYAAEDRERRIRDVIRQLGLMSCADSLTGLSCGERKRLAVARELLTAPSILICDEPTSGLDSFMAGHLLSCLRSLSSQGLSVVLSLHQPTSQQFHSFHRICIMASGRLLYLGEPEKAVQLFEKCGYPTPDYSNPADHMIRTISIGGAPTERRIRKKYEKKIKGPAQAQDTKSNGSDSTNQYRRSSAPFYVQFLALLWRCWATVTRNKTLIKTRFVQVLIVSSITGSLYLDTQMSVATVLSFHGMIFSLARYCNTWTFDNVGPITGDLPMVFEETADMMYSPAAYFLAKNIAELPQYLVMPLIFNTIIYWMSGLYRSFVSYMFANLVVVVTTNTSISIGHMFACIFVTADLSFAFLPLLLFPLFALGGIFIAIQSIPVYFQWLGYLSYIRYGYMALSVNEWENIHEIPGCTSINTTCPHNGFEVLDSIQPGLRSKWSPIVSLLIMTAVIRTISYVALHIRVRRLK